MKAFIFIASALLCGFLLVSYVELSFVLYGFLMLFFLGYLSHGILVKKFVFKSYKSKALLFLAYMTTPLWLVVIYGGFKLLLAGGFMFENKFYFF